jgi:hypothetical protein
MQRPTPLLYVSLAEREWPRRSPLAFNVLNTPDFANPSSDVSTPRTFSVISALTVNPRIMQYALKLEF